MNEIKPCPFCGGVGSVSNDYDANSKLPDDEQFFVRCLSCACEGPWARLASNAITLWNMRHENVQAAAH